MYIIKTIFIIPSVISIILGLAVVNGFCKIHKKIHNDGTIEYYNVKETPASDKKKDLSSKYDELINSMAKQKGVDPYLIKCLIKVESNFKADAVSLAGAMGLMQLMQDTAEYYNVADPLDPEENLRAGISHLKELLNYFKNDVPLALAAYHAGIGRVKKNMSVPPIKATIDYVNRVMYLYRGEKNFDGEVKKLYKRIEKDGTIVIYSK